MIITFDGIPFGLISMLLIIGFGLGCLFAIKD